MKVEISLDEQGRVVRKSLRKTIEALVQQRNLVTLNQRGFVFSIDAKEDILTITHLIDAMILTHNYYSKEEEKLHQEDFD